MQRKWKAENRQLPNDKNRVVIWQKKCRYSENFHPVLFSDEFARPNMEEYKTIVNDKAKLSPGKTNNFSV